MPKYYQTIKSWDECQPDRYCVVHAPRSVELHISNDTTFPRKFGKQVKLAGGRFNTVRGRSFRWVLLPVNADTLELIDTIVHQYANGGLVTMIARDTSLLGQAVPAWVDVHRVSRDEANPTSAFLAAYWRAIDRARERGIADIHEGEPPEPDHLLYATRRVEKARKELAYAEKALAIARQALADAEAEVAALSEKG